MVLSSQRVSAPCGNFCDFYRSRNGTPLSKYKGFTVSNQERILNTIILAAMRRGRVLVLADGTRIVTEDERLALMDDITRSVTEGGFMILSDWVAVRTWEFCEGTRLGEQKSTVRARL